jgi:hypothetical protein
VRSARQSISPAHPADTCQQPEWTPASATLLTVNRRSEEIPHGIAAPFPAPVSSVFPSRPLPFSHDFPARAPRALPPPRALSRGRRARAGTKPQFYNNTIIFPQILYGQAFQLLHVQSGKYVACPSGPDGDAAGPADGGEEGAAQAPVRLLRGGADALLRIAAPHGAKLDSDPVLRGDVVSLVPVLSPKVR